MFRSKPSGFRLLAVVLLAVMSPALLAVADAEPAHDTSPPPVGTGQSAAPDYPTQVQPIFNRRCIACHGCLGSPCNVKLDSFRGAERGGFGKNPYSVHLGDYPRTDMDAADSTAAWRERGFYPILADSGSPRQNLDDSLLFALVDAGMRHNVAEFSRAALNGLRPQRYVATCPATPEALAAQLQQHPAMGMPFGLPAISTKDFSTLRGWVAAGSPGPTKEQQEQARAVSNSEAVAAWEGFFNAPDKRTQLVSRFIFEHVFLATIVLDDSPNDQFRLVRSSTPPVQVVDDGQGGWRVEHPPVRVIGTGLPYDDPYSYAGVDRFWYRLEKLTAAPVQKNHFLWRLGPDDIAHLRGLFRLDDGSGWDGSADLDPPWGIGNPFRVFAAIPAEARYRFLLENAEVIVGGITYGPVCNGQTATYAVKDQFWVFFLDPADDPAVQDPQLGLDTWELFMDRTVSGNAEYLDARAAALARLRPAGWSLDAIWDGAGDNPNAWLTVLRHETNISVLQGAQGGIPRTFWLIGYSGLERMYYDTVAGFAYWEGDADKLQTLLFFNFLRQEFEDNFLLLLPPQQREPIREQWTQGIGAIGLMVVPFAGEDQPTKVRIGGVDPLLDLVGQISAHLGPKISGLPDLLNPRVKPHVKLDAPMNDFADWDAAISTQTAVKGLSFVPHLPSVIVLRLNHGDRHRVYSLIANRAYKSQFTLVFQNGQALPKEDTMSVYPTLVNGFPNLFVDLDLANAPRFLTDLRAVQSKDDWQQFEIRYGILRNSEHFWPFYDWLADWNFSTRGDVAGWLDLTYYDALERDEVTPSLTTGDASQRRVSAMEPSGFALFWAGVLAAAILIYVILDGFDLGVGVLFGTTRDEAYRVQMMDTIAPFWDGNETWLVVIGAGLFAAFPSVYAVFLGAFYLPVLLLLFGLIFRGIAFEFRFRSQRMRPLWDWGFFLGSAMVAFVQGAAVGAMLRGIPVTDGQYAGGPFDWIHPFAILTGIGLVLGYALLGAGWVVLKSEGELRDWAYRRIPWLAAGMLAILLLAFAVTFDYGVIAKSHWGERPWGVVFPVMGVLGFVGILLGARRQYDMLPFAMTVLLFLAAFLSLGVVFWPYMIPYALTVADAAAPDASLEFLFYGGVVVLPVIAVYTIGVYWVFRGKVRKAPSL